MFPDAEVTNRMLNKLAGYQKYDFVPGCRILPGADPFTLLLVELEPYIDRIIDASRR